MAGPNHGTVPSALPIARPIVLELHAGSNNSTEPGHNTPANWSHRDDLGRIRAMNVCISYLMQGHRTVASWGARQWSRTYIYIYLTAFFVVCPQAPVPASVTGLIRMLSPSVIFNGVRSVNPQTKLVLQGKLHCGQIRTMIIC